MLRSSFLVFLTLVACGGTSGDVVLARVSGRPVTASEFQREVRGVPFTSGEYLRSLPGRKELLELLVRRKVVLAEAEKSAVARNPKVVAKLAEMEVAFERQKRDARDRYLVGEFIRSLQGKDLKVTEEESRRAWEQEEEVRASHILVSDPVKAKELKERVDKGENFGALARKFSEDADSGRRGGDLGYLLRGTLTPEFENALFALKTGETSEPVTSPYGFHIIQRTGGRKLSQKPFDQVSETVRSVLEKQKLQTWIDQTRKRHRIFTDVAALQKLASEAEKEIAK